MQLNPEFLFSSLSLIVCSLSFFISIPLYVVSCYQSYNGMSQSCVYVLCIDAALRCCWEKWF